MKKIVLLIGLFLMASCSTKEEAPVESSETAQTILELTDKQLTSFELSTVQLQEKAIVQTIRLTGVIDLPPQNAVSISASLGGHLKSTKLMPGMHFKKGEVLAVLEDSQYIQLQQDYLTSKAQLQNAYAEYVRQKELNQSKASSDKVYQQAKADYETLLISKEALEEKLRLIHINPSTLTVHKIARTVNIYAPFEGYVSKVNVNTGKYISPSEVMFELVNLNTLYLNLKVFEKDWGKWKIGHPITAYSNDDPTEKYAGKISLMGKSITNERTLEMYATFDTYNPKLLPGMYMNAEIEISDALSWALPEECVLSFEGKTYAFVALDKNTFEMIHVQSGNSGNGWIAIENSEKFKDKNIVQKGAYTLLMALKNIGEE